MKTAFTTLIEDIILYNNNRFLILLFLAALIFLWITERDKRIKTVLVYGTSYSITFNNFFTYFVAHFMHGLE